MRVAGSHLRQLASRQPLVITGLPVGLLAARTLPSPRQSVFARECKLGARTSNPRISVWRRRARRRELARD